MTILPPHGTTYAQPLFEFIQGALTAAAVDKLSVQMSFLTDGELCNPSQTGVRLSDLQDGFNELLPLTEIAERFTGNELKLIFARSACRRQKPQQPNGLALHQDLEALGPDPKRAMRGAVMWLPLHDISDDTPALELCPVDPGCFLYHFRDGRRYSVVEEPPDVPLFTVSRMKAGDALIMSPRTLHRTSCKPWHTQERISLDLRFLPD